MEIKVDFDSMCTIRDAIESLRVNIFKELISRDMTREEEKRLRSELERTKKLSDEIDKLIMGGEYFK